MAINKNTTAVGFIGLGIMGLPMAGHIMDAGFSLHVHNRTKKSGQPLLDRGAQWHDNPADVARHDKMVMLVEQTQVEETQVVITLLKLSLLKPMVLARPTAGMSLKTVTILQ